VSSASNTVTGGGLFEGKTTVRTISPINNDNWACFLEFSGDGFSSNNPDKNQVILSSMKDANSLSGLNLGINGSNRLYVEYISGVEGSNTHRVVNTLDKHLRKMNLLSVSKNSESLEISLHNPNYETATLSTEIPKFANSETFYVGGFAKGNSYSHFYTGFHGVINNFLLFDDYLPLQDRDSISKAYYTDEIKDPRAVTGAHIAKEVTGVQVRSLLSGTGVLSYEQIQSGTLNAEFGNIPVYVNSGVTGEIYGNFLVDLTGSNDITSVTGYYSGESEVINDPHITLLNNVPGKIAFAKPVEIGDSVEIYNHNSFIDTLNFSVVSDVSNFGITAGGANIRGYYIQNDNFSFNDLDAQPHFQLHRNGLLLQEVSGSYNVREIFSDRLASVGTESDANSFSGDYFIDDPREDKVEDISYGVVLNDSIDTFRSTDDIFFDIVSGVKLTGVYSGVSAHYTGEYYNEELNPGKDIYFNGVKLLSGKDYGKSEVSHNGEMKLSYFLDSGVLGRGVTGKLLFVPQASNSFTRTTGGNFSGDNSNSLSVPNIFFEQVWKNGIRQIPGVDYFRFAEESIITGINSPSAINESFEQKSSLNDIDVTISSAVDVRKERLFSLTLDEDLNFIK